MTTTTTGIASWYRPWLPHETVQSAFCESWSILVLIHPHSFCCSCFTPLDPISLVASTLLNFRNERGNVERIIACVLLELYRSFTCLEMLDSIAVTSWEKETNLGVSRPFKSTPTEHFKSIRLLYFCHLAPHGFLIVIILHIVA